MKKNFLAFFLILFLLGDKALCETTIYQSSPQQASPIQPQPADFSICNKFFDIPSENLFYLTLSAVNANRFNINELQSKCGFILFSVGQRQFLASIISIDKKHSMLKITPIDNIYFFPIGIIQNMFKYVELNINTPIEKIKRD